MMDSTHYDTKDETDVAQGIYDALTLDHKDEKGADWLGWKFGDPFLGEIEITTPEGGRYLLTVEPIED